MATLPDQYLQQKKVIKATAELFWNEGRLRMTIPKAIREMIDGLNDKEAKCCAVLELCSDMKTFKERADKYCDAKIIPLYFGIIKKTSPLARESSLGGDRNQMP